MRQRERVGGLSWPAQACFQAQETVEANGGPPTLTCMQHINELFHFHHFFSAVKPDLVFVTEPRLRV